MSKAMRVCFYLRSGYKTPDGKTPILIRIYLNSERISVGTTNCAINANLWDKTKGRAKGRTAEAMAINNELDRIETNLMFVYRRHEFDENLSLDLIKAEFLGKTEDDTKQSFVAFFGEYINQITEEVGITRAMASVEKMTVLKKRFETFIKKRYNRKDMLMNELNFKVITDFEHYLLTEAKCCHNTVMRMIRNSARYDLV